MLVGKTNLDEFAMGSSTENSGVRSDVQPARHHARARVASSGGSAAAVAAGFAAVGLGSDTGGSIRQPAALCGVVGVKPTYGYVSRYGLIAFASSLDQIGPFTTTVHDAALVLDAIGGHDPMDSTSIPSAHPSLVDALDRGVEGLRVGRITDLPGGADADVAERLEVAFDALRDAGATIVDVQVPAFGYALTAYYLIAPAEASSNLARFDGVRYGLRVEAADTNAMYGATRAAGFGDEVKRRIMLGTYALSAGYYDAYYGRALKVRRLIHDDFARAYQQAEVLLTPTSPTRGVGRRRQGRRPVGDVPVRHLHDPHQPVGPSGHERAVRHRRRRPADRSASAGRHPGRTHHVPRRRSIGACSMSADPRVEQVLPHGYQLVVGLEVHVELATATKLFSASPNRFGDEPNTNIDPVTLGLPGALPVLNRHAVELAMRIGVCAQLHDPSRARSTARTTSIRTCPRRTRSASTTSR